MNRESNKAEEIKVCTWCKDQIDTSEAEHVSTCAVIPDDERAKLQKQHTNAVETIPVTKQA